MESPIPDTNAGEEVVLNNDGAVDFGGAVEAEPTADLPADDAPVEVPMAAEDPLLKAKAMRAVEIYRSSNMGKKYLSELLDGVDLKSLSIAELEELRMRCNVLLETRDLSRGVKQMCNQTAIFTEVFLVTRTPVKAQGFASRFIQDEPIQELLEIIALKHMDMMAQSAETQLLLAVGMLLYNTHQINTAKELIQKAAEKPNAIEKPPEKPVDVPMPPAQNAEVIASAVAKPSIEPPKKSRKRPAKKVVIA